jgi:hypothetical protein
MAFLESFYEIACELFVAFFVHLVFYDLACYSDGQVGDGAFELVQAFLELIVDFCASPGYEDIGFGFGAFRGFAFHFRDDFVAFFYGFLCVFSGFGKLRLVKREDSGGFIFGVLCFVE